MSTTIAARDISTAPVRARRRLAPWQVLAGFAVASAVAYVFLTPFQYFIYPVFTCTAMIAMSFGIVRHRPERRAAFWVLVAGMATQWFGDLAFFSYSRVLGEVPYPSIADALYLASYALFALGFVLLVRGRTTCRAPGAFIDTAITITAFGLLEYVLLIQPNLWDASQPLLARMVSTAYPVADIIILGLLARLLVSPGARTTSFRFLAFAFMLILGADSVYGTLMQYGLYEGGLIDVGWIVGYSWIAVALLHPSVRTLGAPSADAPPRLTTRRLLVLAVMTMIAPVLFAVTAHDRLTLSLTIAISAGAVILFLLVVARVAGLNRALDASMQDVVRAQQARDRMLRQTLRASEDQRSMIANELHDGPLQHLTALLYRLQGARTSASDWDAKVASFQDAVSSEITSIRRMMTTLRPGALVERGLEGSLKDFADDVFAGTPTSCGVRVVLRERPSLDLETLIYRIAQESITDAADAGATTISVAVTDEDAAIELTIGSDSPAASHADPDEDLRLFSVKERVEMVGGRFAVEWSDGRVISRARFPEGVNV